MEDYVIEMRDIVKDFPGIRANDHVSLQLRRGEILALLGENGAGKSTLMSILFGLYSADSGSIFVKGRQTSISSPIAANNLGIGMVHQHFKLVRPFTVAENIVLGMEPRRGPLLDLKQAVEKIAAISKKYNLDVDPNAKIEDITVGMQQRVEIIKMLYRDAEILIFDEPTAVLTPAETGELISILRSLTRESKSIILITHKLREIKLAADRCTILRRGRTAGTVDVKLTTEKQMAEMMVGREISFVINKKETRPGDPVLVIDDLNVKTHLGSMGLHHFSLIVRSGEIVGIAGVDGNGQTELVEAITGLRKIESGKIRLNGKPLERCPVVERIAAGISHIPEDRQKHGLVMQYTLEDNFILEIYGRRPFSKYGILNRRAIRQYAEGIIRDFDVRSGEGPSSSALTLSGGNQQKAIIGREIERKHSLLIAVQPTRGLDVGSIEYIHRRIVEQRDKGKAVLLVSLDLDEVMQLSDRIVALYGGRLTGEVTAKDATESEISLMMAGLSGKHGKGAI
ncbi:MAG: ABC transporter ATP-binding protein [Treponema sp.]|jgi:simple sugar transport system ATP-binding protein|nr:ABC transporter ATP-binding protein [Treponema sp.]